MSGTNAIRPGERALPTPATHDAFVTFIGVIETPWVTREACPRQGDQADGPPCRLLVDPQWADALSGIDDHGALQLLYWMHEARRDLVLLAPRSRETPTGVFSLRAPTRPNPIASSIVTLVERCGTALVVKGLDCVTGTPLLDIKPWRGVSNREPRPEPA